MKKTDARYSLKDVEKLLQLKTWWASICVLPLANRVALFLANYTKITPNQITIASFVLRTLSGLAFMQGTKATLVLGALFYYLAYVLDCVDGPIARLKGMTSEFGRYLDHLSDLVGDMFILLSLAYGQDMLFTPLVLAMLFAHVVEYYVSFLTGTILRGNVEPKKVISFGMIRAFARYRDLFFKRNFKSFVSFPDYEAVVFVFFPLLGKAGRGLHFGFYMLLIVVTYTILSSFMSIMTCTKRFP